MSCTKYQQMISKLLDGELHEPAAESLRLHVSRCKECRAFAERTTALEQDLRILQEIRPRSALAEQVKERIAGLRSGSPSRLWFSAWVQLPLAAVLVLCALGVGNLAGKSLSEMLVSHREAGSIDLLVTDAGHSFTDVLLEIGGEGNTP
ncbi:MAG: zf-HC2 domain-containing protein [Desulfomonilaceae bacterium]|nr:zf-HC2 domain-containing protein [Desulfomonilaceae bacterium]